MTLQTTLRRTSETAAVVADDARDLIKGHLSPASTTLDQRQQDSLADLRRDGYAVIENYWPRDRALELGRQLERELESGADRDYESGAYLRFWDNRSYDQGVRRLYHVDKLLPELSEFRHDPFSLEIVRAYYRVPFHPAMLVFQHNTRSNHDTRYYHVDGFSREFKSFLYLDDVDEGNGPFTYIPGTHRSHVRRLRKQLVGNGEGSPTSFHVDEIERALDREVQITGPAGTMILADVRGLHRGSPQRVGSRSVLVCYMLKHPGEIFPDK
jgi:Phytanoyl-CoA dioxygenase (PhyH)